MNATVEGRGTLGTAAAVADRQLVARVRRGDDRAFEVLYRRYHRRIAAYVQGMVKDHGRAEDVTQEVFVSALRRMRQTERPIAFKPWIYEIARNACIDAFRRMRRAEEVSFDAQDALAPQDLGRLAEPGPSPPDAVAAKQELDHLRGAFGGLSDTHHEILVMRELEGRSYREIGERLGMSRPAVESTLYRARKRLTEEYDELASGARCLRVQGIIAQAGSGAVGARDTRRVARHLADCQPCRRLAVLAGLDIAALGSPSRRRRIASRVAGWLPFPIPLVRRLAGSSATVANTAGLAAAGGEPACTGWGKLAIAAATVVFAGVGAGVGGHAALGGHREAAVAGGVSAGTASADDASGAARAAASRVSAARAAAAERQRDGRAGRRGRGGGAAGTGAGGSGAPGGASAPRAAGGGAGGGSSGRSAGDGSAPAGHVGAGTAPAQPVKDAAGQATGAVGQTLQGATGAAGQAVQGTTGAAGQAVQGTTGAAGQAVQGTTGAAGQAVQGTTGAAGQAVQGTTGAAGQAVQGTTGAAAGAGTQAVQGATGPVTQGGLVP